MKAQKMC